MEFHLSMARSSGRVARERCLGAGARHRRGTDVEDHDEEKCPPVWVPSKITADYWDHVFTKSYQCWARYKRLWDQHHNTTTRKTGASKQEEHRESSSDPRLLVPPGFEMPISFQDFAFAYVLSTSRSFDLHGLVPVMDFANTAETINVFQEELFDNSTKDEQAKRPPHGGQKSSSRAGSSRGFCLIANRDIKKHEQISLDYAQLKKDPWRFFNVYGFTLRRKSHKRGDWVVERSEVCAALAEDVLEMRADARKRNGVLDNLERFWVRWCGTGKGPAVLHGGSVPAGRDDHEDHEAKKRGHAVRVNIPEDAWEFRRKGGRKGGSTSKKDEPASNREEL